MIWATSNDAAQIFIMNQFALSISHKGKLRQNK